MPIVGKSQDLVVDQDDIARAETRLLPLDLAGGDLDAFHRAGRVFLEAEHAVEMAVPHDRRAPVIGDVVISGNFVKLRGGEFIPILGNPAGAAANSVAGRAIDDVVELGRGF
ncbi:MAG: hypothetical protein NTW03_03840, partial [Verrucomicrobia bacterium]|nr:hypothetical protein [Verrucomicrobiota bacterium]